VGLQDRALVLQPADFAQERAHGRRELVGVLAVGVVASRRGADVDAQSLSESIGDLGEDGKGVLADEQAYRRGDRGQRLIVG
jgi:hypothetical protein